jgi:hypothetical protein
MVFGKKKKVEEITEQETTSVIDPKTKEAQEQEVTTVQDVAYSMFEKDVCNLLTVVIQELQMLRKKVEEE